MTTATATWTTSTATISPTTTTTRSTTTATAHIVAGIVAAAGNNGLDVAGVCWNARIMPIKILGADGDGSAADAVPAIYYAVANGADIISGSWGGQDSSDALREAIAYAHRQGVIVVAAAGNEDSDTPYYPAAYPGRPLRGCHGFQRPSMVSLELRRLGGHRGAGTRHRVAEREHPGP